MGNSATLTAFKKLVSITYLIFHQHFDAKESVALFVVGVDVLFAVGGLRRAVAGGVVGVKHQITTDGFGAGQSVEVVVVEVVMRSRKVRQCCLGDSAVWVVGFFVVCSIRPCPAVDRAEGLVGDVVEQRLVVDGAAVFHTVFSNVGVRKLTPTYAGYVLLNSTCSDRFNRIEIFPRIIPKKSNTIFHHQASAKSNIEKAERMKIIPKKKNISERTPLFHFLNASFIGAALHAGHNCTALIRPASKAV